MSKIVDKFEINRSYNLTDKSKFIYVENRVSGKALQHLKPCLQINSISFFTTIKDLFNYLKNIFDNSY